MELISINVSTFNKFCCDMVVGLILKRKDHLVHSILKSHNSVSGESMHALKYNKTLNSASGTITIIIFHCPNDEMSQCSILIIKFSVFHSTMWCLSNTIDENPVVPKTNPKSSVPHPTKFVLHAAPSDFDQS